MAAQVHPQVGVVLLVAVAPMPLVELVEIQEVAILAKLLAMAAQEKNGLQAPAITTLVAAVE